MDVLGFIFGLLGFLIATTATAQLAALKGEVRALAQQLRESRREPAGDA